MHALRSSLLLMPYFDVVRAAGWLLLLSKATASCLIISVPTWNDLNDSANSLTRMNL